ncbi:hypothetical protein FA13DRAFT_1329799 [Coprinellus micaceus]|uniref:Uncharacterized protein n=1 Tax=Coprinellus micaceus TaxID=71717 RepID=A0A4Y7SSH9_COPMI|nr:hypothetical protein FA13DRAFT_1329799 [Coprinellus micaceus]
MLESSALKMAFLKIFNLWDDEASIRNSPAGASYPIPYAIFSKPKLSTDLNALHEGKALVEGVSWNPIYESDNQTISCFEFHHMETHQQGSVLAVTSAAKLEELGAADRMNLRKVISRYAGLLYRYANGLHLIGEQEALYILTGCIKSESWGIAAFRHRPDSNHVPKLVRLSGAEPAEIDPPGSRYRWRSPGTFDAGHRKK